MKKNDNYKITIIGSGAFGTAIANSLIIKNKDVLIYGISESEINDINTNHKNSKYYNNKLNSNLKATLDKKEAFKDRDIFFFAIPSSTFSSVLKNDLIPNLTKHAYFVNLSKGFDYSGKRVLSDLISEIIPSKFNLGVLKLSGPSFASELVAKTPTVLNLACKNHKTAKRLAPHFETDFIRVISTNNILAVETLSIIKNSLAILMGISNGLKLGDNMVAFLFFEIIEESIFLLENMGSKAKDIISPAGIGDLFLTSTSIKSRNYSVGFEIGKTDKVTTEIIEKFKTVEGINSIKIINELIESYNLKSRLFKMLYNIVCNKELPSKVISLHFKERELKNE